MRRCNLLASVEGHTPVTHPSNSILAEGEVDEEESSKVAVAPPVIKVVPMHYQWVSTLCPLPNALLGDKMLLSFSVPTLLLPMPHEPAARDANRDTKMGMQVQQVPKPHALAICDIDGCSEKGKYRLVYREGKGGNSIMLLLKCDSEGALVSQGLKGTAEEEIRLYLMY